MHMEQVEIYSDATNAAILRHPSRKFPGVLVQGDTLSTLCDRADSLCLRGQDQLDPEFYQELSELRTSLCGFLTHYKTVAEHHISLLFNDKPRPAVS